MTDEVSRYSTYDNLVCETATGTGSSVALVPTGEKVLVTSFFYRAQLADQNGIIENGAGVDAWNVQSSTDDLHIACFFPHPLLLDGLGIVVSAGTGEWSISFKRLSV